MSTTETEEYACYNPVLLKLYTPVTIFQIYLFPMGSLVLYLSNLLSYSLVMASKKTIFTGSPLHYPKDSMRNGVEQ